MRRDLESEFSEMAGDGCIAPRGVVRDVADGAFPLGAVQAVHGVRDRPRPCVDDPVQVREHRVDPIERRRRLSPRAEPDEVVASEDAAASDADLPDDPGAVLEEDVAAVLAEGEALERGESLGGESAADANEDGADGPVPHED